MKGDAFNYKRAVGVSVLGLTIQVIVCIAFVIHVAYNRSDHAALTAATYIGLGIPVWATLALLFDFHRRERLEAIEAERLASDPAASAFDDAGDEILVASRRLHGVQRYLMPIVSLSVGGSLIAIGVVRFMQVQDQNLTDPGVFSEIEHKGWAVAIGLTVAFIGFVFARFVSGMAKQKLWSSLRAGASWAVGAALLGLSIALAHFLQMAANQDAGLRYIQAVFPIAMIVLGGEVFLNFLLDLYRPRLPGEDPRAAFDSRVLGLLAAPDRIAENIGEALNYQFGVQVTDSWFYQLLRRWWIALVGLAALVVWGMTTLTIIEPHQRGLYTVNGGVASAEELDPGLHFKLPFPFGRVEVPRMTTERFVGDGRTEEEVSYTATGVRRINLGTNSPNDDADAILWTNDHTAEEIFNLVQPTRIGADRRSDDEEDGTGDLSLVAIEAPVQWSVDSVLAFDRLAAPGDREQLIEAMGQREMTLFLSGKNIDDVLGGDRQELVAELEQRLENAYRSLAQRANAALGGFDNPEVEAWASEAPIEVISVGTGNTHPPRDTAESFEQLIQAQQQYAAALELARGEEIKILSEAAGNVEQAKAIVAALEAIEEARVLGADQTELVRRELEVQRMIEAAGGSSGSALVSASAERWRRHMGERGRAALYQGQLASFEAAPALFMSQRYFDAVSSAMADARVYWIGNKISDALTVIDLQTDRQVDVFNPEAGAQFQN